MNQHDPNEIERQLEALRPAEPDASLRDRIKASLEAQGDEPTAQTLKFPRPLIYALAAAACVALAAVVWVSLGPGPAVPPIVVVPEPVAPDAPVVSEGDASPTPTHYELRQAMQRSPEAFEQALDAAVAADRGSASGPRIPMYTFADGRRFSRMENLP